MTQLATAIEPFLDVRFAFFGHSFGALLAFETVRELRRRGCPEPVHFIASARSAPQLPIAWEPVSGLPEPEFIAEIRRRYNAIPDAILADRELMSMYLPVLRADLEILETYVYSEEAPLVCSISAFGGTADRTVTEEQLEAWKLQTAGIFKLRMFAGDHFFPRVLQQPFPAAISEELMRYLGPMPNVHRLRAE